MPQTRQATIVKPSELAERRRSLPDRWKQAAGMFRHHKADLERHIKRVRKEWSRRASHS